MAKIIRPTPRRNPGRYPLGTRLTFRDGRTFEVVERIVRVWVDPSMGNGGGNLIDEPRHAWRAIPNE